MGRKRIEIPLPDRTFTSDDLRRWHPEVSESAIYSRLKEWIHRQEVRMTGEKLKEGRIRKPHRVYEPCPGGRGHDLESVKGEAAIAR